MVASCKMLGARRLGDWFAQDVGRCPVSDRGARNWMIRFGYLGVRKGLAERPSRSAADVIGAMSRARLSAERSVESDSCGRLVDVTRSRGKAEKITEIGIESIERACA